MNTNTQHNIFAHKIQSPIGNILAIASQSGLVELKIDHQYEDAYIGKATPILLSIERELASYFLGKLQKFNTPIHLHGTPFQKTVWKSLLHIPYGKTISYLEEAAYIGNPKATRAVANANGANKLPTIIPCHRVVRHNGQLGGYALGVDKKTWLLNHEKYYQLR
jgi:O-6-methylguanine DNA methyltransferase